MILEDKNIFLAVKDVEKLKRIKIKLEYFFNEVEKYLSNKKGIKPKIETDGNNIFIITVEEKKYVIDITKITSEKKLDELCEKYKQLNDNMYDNTRPLTEFKEEIKTLKENILKDSLMGSLRFLRVAAFPMSVGLSVYLIPNNFWGSNLIGLTWVLVAGSSCVDFALGGILKVNNIFNNLSETTQNLKKNRRILKKKGKILERRELIAKIEELNNRDSNGINIDKEKEEQIAKLLKKLKNKTSYGMYESIVQDIFKKEEKLAIESPDNEIVVDQPSETVGYAYQTESVESVKKKVLVR